MSIPRNGSVGMLDAYLNIASQAFAGESPQACQTMTAWHRTEKHRGARTIVQRNIQPSLGTIGI